MVNPPQPPPKETVLRGRCWVIDGDTIVIDKIRLRLAGIDAPELDHPWGQQSKWAMVKLCKGQTVTARIKPELSYDRIVAQCFLPDGRDLAAELVRIGLALDWPKFSGGKYRHLEPEDARRKLWRAELANAASFECRTSSQFAIPTPNRALLSDLRAFLDQDFNNNSAARVSKFIDLHGSGSKDGGEGRPSGRLQ